MKGISFIKVSTVALQKTGNKLLVGNDDKNGTASVFIFNLDTRTFENRINIGLLDKITDIKCI